MKGGSWTSTGTRRHISIKYLLFLSLFITCLIILIYYRIDIMTVNYYSYKLLLVIVAFCTHFMGRGTSCRNTQIFAHSLQPGWTTQTLSPWNFKRTIGVRAEDFLTLRELPWQQWQAVINPRREWRRMVERGGEEEETDRRTDWLTLPRSPR